MARRYPPEVREFIREHVVGRTCRELVALVNETFGEDLFTEETMKNFKHNNKLRSGTPKGLPAGTPTKVFPAEVMEYIRANYIGVGPTEMAQRLNAQFGTSYKTQQLNAYYKNHHINSGITGRFEKGCIPPNKGKKGYCAPGSEKGWFKPGTLPADTKPIGHERVNHDGYTEIKVKMRPSRKDCNDNFVAKHRYVWERAHGPIPPGMIVTFLDGDRSNFDLDNLALVSMAENQMLNRHKLRFDDADLTRSGIAVAKVQVAIKKRVKNAPK